MTIFKEGDEKTHLLKLLMIVDEELPQQEMFTSSGASGLELLVAFFNMTYYGDGVAYTVSNGESLEAESHSRLAVIVKIKENSIES